MTKEEYLKAKKDRVEKMPLEHLRRAYTNLDEITLKYFTAWNKAEERIKELEMFLFQFRQADVSGSVCENHSKRIDGYFRNEKGEEVCWCCKKKQTDH